MKNIRISKEKDEDGIFEIQGYSFVEVESEYPSIPIYRLTVKKNFNSSLDVRYWLEEINGNICTLSEVPSELTDYIKKYEENIHFKDSYLFHDLRTRYVDFYLYEENGLKNNILLVGYTLLDEETCFAVKAFSLMGLAAFSQTLLEYCNKRRISVESQNNLRWIQLEQSMLPDTNLQRNDIFEGFLQKTLMNEYCGIFFNAFRNIDSQGYLNKSFFETTIIKNGNEINVGKIKQFTKYFSRFWKTEISIKDAHRTVLCLHDELLNDVSIEKMVYTIKPHLMQYYQLHWFEDFCSEIIKNTIYPDFTIYNSYSGRKFNFFQNGNENDSREIDMILGIECNGDYKIIAIECKKTLSNYEIKDTNGKIKSKVLKSHTNVIDAYIHIGCFNNDVEFDKVIQGTQEKYKQGLIQLKNEEVYDAPYFAFSISSVENLELKMCYVINEIFEQW